MQVRLFCLLRRLADAFTDRNFFADVLAVRGTIIANSLPLPRLLRLHFLLMLEQVLLRRELAAAMMLADELALLVYVEHVLAKLALLLEGLAHSGNQLLARYFALRVLLLGLGLASLTDDFALVLANDVLPQLVLVREGHQTTLDRGVRAL